MRIVFRLYVEAGDAADDDGEDARGKEQDQDRNNYKNKAIECKNYYPDGLIPLANGGVHEGPRSRAARNQSAGPHLPCRAQTPVVT